MTQYAQDPWYLYDSSSSSSSPSLSRPKSPTPPPSFSLSSSSSEELPPAPEWMDRPDITFQEYEPQLSSIMGQMMEAGGRLAWTFEAQADLVNLFRTYVPYADPARTRWLAIEHHLKSLSSNDDWPLWIELWAIFQ